VTTVGASPNAKSTRTVNVRFGPQTAFQRTMVWVRGLFMLTLKRASDTPPDPFPSVDTKRHVISRLRLSFETPWFRALCRSGTRRWWAQDPFWRRTQRKRLES